MHYPNNVPPFDPSSPPSLLKKRHDSLTAPAASTTQDDIRQRLKELNRSSDTPALNTGWRAPGGHPILLARGTVHEWFASDLPPAQPSPAQPPICLFLHLAAAAATSIAPATTVLWIGRDLWPAPWVLEHLGLLRASLFVDPPDASSRLWAIDLALRTGATTGRGVAAVIADGSGFDMAATRRLQLSAQRHDGHAAPLCLLARPLRDRKLLSAAASRWLVTPQPGASGSFRPRWSIRALRMKAGGTDLSGLLETDIELEWNHEALRLAVAAPLGNRSAPPLARSG